MKDLEIQRLLLDSGFKPAPPPPSARWALIGEYEPAQELRVTCALGARGGFVLLVGSERERKWLVDRLATTSLGAIDVRAERMEPKAPWLALTVGVGVSALALFGWVMSSIHPFFP